MKIIKKKIWPEYFELVQAGKKRFELRVADFDVEEGDVLILEEWNPQTKEYTGRKIEKKIDYILKFDLDSFGQKEEIEKNGLFIIQLTD
ncbi:RNA-binding protein [bacterium (Candidatus Gribaldobacteria) CG23_combo_of_CG06-09_8_20_14_all_37_87_8]|uniref:RNA-binding protein n=2 Tax=Candidatus Gribaldobacteria TaxID=2798536 RepID=A0A2G9ZEA9_9BACT|nr:MAG: RNA-binding protein [bacterium (Candidatus Gribaldobacteria) CG23_combo_of_CG06-09_8_20_14_all_37_87_8]PIR90303.1 MAG: RNA-binding protein [bacterium (Candidatus Gribaldobacteria) CG10_big_fil_rev_8_21_14_0_10_37_21]